MPTHQEQVKVDAKQRDRLFFCIVLNDWAGRGPQSTSVSEVYSFPHNPSHLQGPAGRPAGFAMTRLWKQALAQAWNEWNGFCVILTAGLRGRNTSFLSSGFFAAFSRRWDGEPSDLDDAVRFRDKKDRDTWTSECGPRGCPAPQDHLLLVLPACQPCSRQGLPPHTGLNPGFLTLPENPWLSHCNNICSQLVTLHQWYSRGNFR